MYNKFYVHIYLEGIRHRAAIGLAGAIARPLFSMIVLKAIRNMAFSTEIYFLHRTVVYKQERKVAKFILKGAFSDLPRGVV